jgi:hypothetical protein
MTSLRTLASRPEDDSAVLAPDGLEQLPIWLRFVLADAGAQVLAGERAALSAALLATELERDADARTLAARQAADERRHVDFFVEVQSRLGVNRPMNEFLGAMLADAARADSLPSLLLGSHLVIETLGHAIFDSFSTALATQSRNLLFAPQTRDTLGALAARMERLQRDESRHLAYGVLRLRDERNAMSPARRETFDAETARWRARLDQLFFRLPLLVVLRPWLELRRSTVLAHFDARVEAIRREVQP